MALTRAVLERQGMKSSVRRVLQDPFLKSPGPIEEPGEQNKEQVK